MRSTTRLLGAVAAGAALVLSPLATSSAAAAGEAIPDGTQFYVPQVQHYQDALRQVAQLRASGDKAAAADVSYLRCPIRGWWTPGIHETVIASWTWIAPRSRRFRNRTEPAAAPSAVS